MTTDEPARHRHAEHRRARTAARKRRRLLAAVVPVGLVVSSALVWQASYAAFVGTTGNASNAWETGVVALTSDRATALFTTAGEGLLVPGSSGYECITVTYTGSVDTAASGVRLYGAVTANSSPELAAALQITVELSRAALPTAPDANCSPAFDPTPITYGSRAVSNFPTAYATGVGDADGNGVGDWRPTPTAETSRTYKISYSLPANQTYPTSVQGKSVEILFTWEVQSHTPGT